MRAIAISALLFATTARAEAPWQQIATYDDMVVYWRPEPTKPALRQVQVRAHSPLSPAELFRVIWDVDAQHEFVPFVRELTVLSRGDDQVTFYERLHLPVVHDRDYVLRLSKRVSGEHYEVDADGHSELAPAEPKGVVRVYHVWSRIVIDPRNGGSDFVYTSFADPAGHVPAWLVRTADEHGPRDFVRAVFKRALQNRR